MRRDADLRHRCGEAPTAVVAAAVCFRKQMRTVERALDADPTHIMGERLTAADILLSSCISWAVDFGVPVAEAVVACNERVVARPSYARAQ